MYTADLTRPVVECAVPPKIADVAAFRPRLLLSLVFVDSMSLSGKGRVRNCSNHSETDTPSAAIVRLGHINRPETAGDGLTRLSQSISVSPTHLAAHSCLPWAPKWLRRDWYGEISTPICDSGESECRVS